MQVNCSLCRELGSCTCRLILEFPAESLSWGLCEHTGCWALKDGFEKGSGCGIPRWLSWWRICLQCRRHGFDPWVGKIPWRRTWQPTPVFWRILENSMDRGAWRATVHGAAKSQTQLSMHTCWHWPAPRHGVVVGVMRRAHQALWKPTNLPTHPHKVESLMQHGQTRDHGFSSPS